MKRLTEGDSLKFKTLSAEEKSKRGILGRLYGPVASFANPTRNGRKYSQELWEQVFNSDLVKERFANGGIFGELCHPADREEVEMDRVAIVMPEPPVKDDKGNLIAYVDIIDTPAGKIAYQLAKYGYKFGISTRGTGDIIEGVDGDEVDPDTYQLNALDLVEIPAVETARLSFTESLDKKRYGKTLKESLQKVMDKASDDEKKIMTEALDELGLNLNEAEHQYIGMDDVDADKYPYLYDALNCNAVSLVIYDNVINNESFDTELMEENNIDEVAVKDDIERFAEHHDLEFQFDADYSESLEEDSDSDTVLSKVKELMELADKNPELEGIKDKLADICDILQPDEPIEEELNSINGWGEYTNETLEGTFDEIDELISAVRYKSRKSAWFGDTVDDLVYELEKVARHLNDCADTLNNESDRITENESAEGGSDIKEEEVVDDKSAELVAELQESLSRIKKLEEDNISLQEKLSVGVTKETELSEQLSKYKQATARLSESMIKAKKLSKTLKEKEKELSESKKIVENLSKSELSAKMTLSDTEDSLNKLKDKNKTLTESLKTTTEKLTKSQDLVERYKKSYAALKESYLEVKANSYGLKKDAVRQKLGESYKIRDIDSVCEELHKVNTKMNKLPFRVDEKTKIGIKESVVNNNPNSDDFISDSLRNMIL